MSNRFITEREMKKRYNGIMEEVGYEHLIIGKDYDFYRSEEERQEVKNYETSDMYYWLEYVLETFDDSDHSHYTCEPKWRKSVTGKIKRLMDRMDNGIILED